MAVIMWLATTSALWRPWPCVIGSFSTLKVRPTACRPMPSLPTSSRRLPRLRRSPSKIGKRMALFDSDFLKKLEYLSLVSKRVFRGSLLAQRRTMHLGTGIEFADHRQYTPGDDYRYLDWNLFARLDQLL